MGQTGCESTGWLSETALPCLKGHGSQGTRQVAITVGGRVGSVSEGVSFEIRSVSVLRRTNMAGTGSASVTIQGAFLGQGENSGSARVGATGCERTKWGSETGV
eukprot:1170376-Rhodomonas_salina.1